MAIIFPSLISADLLNLEKEIKELDPYAYGYHLDIMDHHFVPNLTWGPAFIEAIARITQRTLWVHLMVDNPKIWVEKLTLPAGSIVSFHIETILKNSDLIEFIQKKRWQASIAISPKTNVEEIFSCLPTIDQVLIMSVEPGWSGQSFLTETVSKVETLTAYRQTHGLKFAIAMDGGISEKNIQELAHKGVDHFAVANAIFGKPDPAKALQELNALVAE